MDKTKSKEFTFNYLLQLAQQNNLGFACFKLPNSAKVELWIGEAIFEPNFTITSEGYLFRNFNQKSGGFKILPTYKFELKGKSFDLKVGNDFSEIKKNVNFNKPIEENHFIDLDYTAWQHLVEKARNSIASNHLKKVVLSRTITLDIPTQFNLEEFFYSLLRTYPNAFVQLVFSPEIGIWAGATPEPFLTIQKGIFSFVALAGTRLLSELPFNEKEFEEQAMVANYIEDILKNYPVKVEINGPISKIAGPVVHLETIFKAKNIALPLVIEIMNHLHPTPAVCGLPKKDAEQFIVNNELHQRRFYSGICGPIENKTNFNLFVNLRCVNITNNKAKLFVGAGITSGSDPLLEWEETNRKADTLKPFFEKKSI